MNRFSRLSNLTFCGSNSYPKQGTNVCLIRYSIYSTLKTLPIADQLTFDFVGLWEFESISLCHLNSQVFCSSDGFWHEWCERRALRDRMEHLEDVAMVGFPSQMLTSPKIRRETNKRQVPSERIYTFRVLFGFYFRRNWTCLVCFCVCMNAFWKQWKIGIKLFPIFICWYRSFSEPEQKTSIWNHVTTCRDGIFRLFTLQPPLPATQGLHNSWIFIIFAARRDARSFWMFQKPPALRCLRKGKIAWWNAHRVSMYSIQTYYTDERFWIMRFWNYQVSSRHFKYQVS